MKLAVLAGAVAMCGATAIAAAQQPSPAEQTQTILGCVKGEGTLQSPWMLTGVVIPAPVPANAGRGVGAGGRGGVGRGGGASREDRAPAAVTPALPPAPIDVRISGMDMTSWRGYRVQVEGIVSPAGAGARTINAVTARSVYNTCMEK